MCTEACTSDQQHIQLDPIFNNFTIISGSFDRNDPSFCSYEAYALPELIEIGAFFVNYQIEVNITELTGVTATFLNGTTLYTADDIESTNEARNFTYNSTDYNNVFINFSPNFDEEESNFFLAFVGLIPRERIFGEDDEDDEAVVRIEIETIDTTIYKHVTFSEWVLILATGTGILAFCCKKRYCENKGAVNNKL